jgi:hypothetical protein
MESLDRMAGPGALFVAEMDRPQGVFRFQVRRADGAPEQRADATPARDDLLGLVPPGSRWMEAVGWSAYFGWPVVARGWHFWSLGVEEVRPQPSGGAYPVVRVYLHGQPPIAALEALAAALDPEASLRGRPSPVGTGVLVLPMAGRTANATRGDQAAILRQAAAACAAGGTPLFRTAVLTEAEALPLAGFPTRLPRGIDRCLLGVPDSLSRGFSSKARALLYLRTFWGPW